MKPTYEALRPAHGIRITPILLRGGLRALAAAELTIVWMVRAFAAHGKRA